MPDHMHFLWVGVATETDQLKASEFFRKHVNTILSPFRFQKQPYDNVLREKDRERNAFRKTAGYILENPVREGLCSSAEQYPWAGSVVPGYPDLDVFDKGYWDLFWRLYKAACEGRHVLTHAATVTRAATPSPA